MRSRARRALRLRDHPWDALGRDERQEQLEQQQERMGRWRPASPVRRMAREGSGVGVEGTSII
jgi:hypothetical protein